MFDSRDFLFLSSFSFSRAMVMKGGRATLNIESHSAGVAVLDLLLEVLEHSRPLDAELGRGELVVGREKVGDEEEPLGPGVGGEVGQDLPELVPGELHHVLLLQLFLEVEAALKASVFSPVTKRDLVKD